MPRFRKVLRAAALLFGIVLLVVAGSLFWFWRQASNIPTVDISPSLDSSAPERRNAINIVVAGIDSAENLADGDPVKDTRDSSSLLADTILLVRVDPISETVSLLSFPRDLWVNVGGEMAKINSAIAKGGPELLISTIREEFNVPVNHFIQVDMAGFVAIVDALGGVPLSASSPVRDVSTGLDLGSGCQAINGQSALALVRSRTAEVSVDGVWEPALQSDFTRISNQQVLVESVIQKLQSGALRNPFTVNNLLTAANAHLILDDTLSLQKLRDLASGFGAEVNFTPFTYPGEVGWAGPQSVVFPKDAPELLERFRDPVNVTVRTNPNNSLPPSVDLLKDISILAIDSTTTPSTNRVLSGPGTTDAAERIALITGLPYTFDPSLPSGAIIVEDIRTSAGTSPSEPPNAPAAPQASPLVSSC